MLKKMKKNNKGFTLVELLVVIAIIGILAIVAVPSLFKNINKAKATDAISYLSAARTAAVAEYASAQAGVTLVKGADVEDGETSLDDLVLDAPEEVEALSVSVDGTSGNVTINATVDEAIEEEVGKQAASSFTGTKVIVNEVEVGTEEGTE